MDFISTWDGKLKLTGRRQIALLAALFAFLLYANTIPNGYAIDDALVITTNPSVQHGFGGIPNILNGKIWLAGNSDLGYYRPLSLVTFAVEQQLFQGNPHISHLVNALFYGLTAYVLLLLLVELFSSYSLLFLLTWTLLFVAHPIHTEVVANIKSRDELLAFLLLLCTAYTLLRWKPGDYLQLFLTASFFYLALLSKESALSGLLLLPGLLYYSRKQNFRQVGGVFSLLGLVVILYLIQKNMVTSVSVFQNENDIVSFPYAVEHVRLPAMFAQVWYYLKLTIFPFPLSYNYAFNQLPVPGWNSLPVWLGLMLTITLILIWLRGLKEKSWYSFSGFLFGVLLFPAIGFVLIKGGVLAERFLYGPVLGFSFAVVWLLFHALHIDIKASSEVRTSIPLQKLLFLLLLPLLYSVSTVQRNFYWKDDSTLSAHDVKVSPNSCQVHLHYGTSLIEKAVKERDTSLQGQWFHQGLEQLHLALAIYPEYARAYFRIGYAYQVITHQSDSAILYYQRTIQFAPAYAPAYKNLALVYMETKQWEKAEQVMERAIQLDSSIKNAESILSDISQKMQQDYAQNTDTISFKYYTDTGVKLAREQKFEEALPYLQKAVQLAPSSAQTLVNIAACYGSMHNYSKSELFLLKAEQLEPNNKLVLQNLYILYRMSGNVRKEEEYLNKLQAR